MKKIVKNELKNIERQFLQLFSNHKIATFWHIYKPIFIRKYMKSVSAYPFSDTKKLNSVPHFLKKRKDFSKNVKFVRSQLTFAARRAKEKLSSRSDRLQTQDIPFIRKWKIFCSIGPEIVSANFAHLCLKTALWMHQNDPCYWARDISIRY